MSIACVLAQTRPTDIPLIPAVLLVLLFAGMSVLSPWLAVRLRIFRPPVEGWPARFGPGDAAWKLLVLLIGAFVLMQAAGLLLYPLLTGLPERERALVAGMLGTAVAFLAVLPLNAALRPDGTRILGLDVGRLPGGFLTGAAGFLIVFPWIFWLMVAGSFVLERFLPEVPREHELFRLWQQPETTGVFRAVALFGAVIVAPFFEELVFRGFLQTGIARLFTRQRSPLIYPPAPLSALPPAPLPADGLLVLDYALITTPSPPQPLTAARWAAIIITSGLFAMIHQPWTITIPIFLLALGLGYVYERTGSLWSCIFLHMLFNGFQFTLFLLMVSR